MDTYSAEDHRMPVHMVEEEGDMETPFENDDEVMNLMNQYIDASGRAHPHNFAGIKMEPQQHPQMMSPYMMNPHMQQIMYSQNQYPPNYNFKNVMPTLNLPQQQQATMQQMQNVNPLNMRPNIMYSQQSSPQAQLSPRVPSQGTPGSPVTVQQLSPRMPHSPSQPSPAQQQQPLSPRLSSSQQMQIQQLQQQQQPNQQLSPRLHMQSQLSPRPTSQLSPRPPHMQPQAPQSPIPLQPYQQLINEIMKLHVTQKEQLEKMKLIQKQVMMHPQKDTYSMLDNEQNSLKKQIDAELTSLQQIDSSYLLSPTEIRHVIYLIHELTIQSIQLELFHDELQLLVAPQNPTPCIAALVIIEQPFPMVITKGKPLEDDPVVVQLLSGSRVEFQSIGKVKASMVVENQPTTKNAAGTKTIETDFSYQVVSMDEAQRIAKYHLKFLNGTRKNPVTLKFSMQVQVVGGAGTVTVESPVSNPFIVITNECQYEESDGTLLKKDSFGNNNEIPWPMFANKLQRHFLRATRQDPIKPTRYLSRHELTYIHHNFFGGQPMVSQTSFDLFWGWFGKNLQKLRYQRHVCSMWQSGLIYGFISRFQVDEALKNEEAGTFLIRFSERHAGLFAVGYKIDDTRVRHYLVRPDDTAGAKKTLPDFLAECNQFNRILQLTIEPITGEPRLRNFPKDVVLEPYYSKRDALQATNGYDPLVVNM